MMKCEIVTSTRHFGELFPHSSSAHVKIDASDKDKALSRDIWEAGVLVRPWQIVRRKEWYINNLW